MIELLDDTYTMILKRIIHVLLPIFLFVLFTTLIKIIIDYKKYGKDIFSVFYKRNQINLSKESLKILLNSLDTNYKLIEINNNTIIMILQSGIYIVYVLEYDGIINGNTNKDKLILRRGMQHKNEIPNPVLIINNIINKIKNATCEEISGYILLKGNCIFDISDKGNIEVISYNSFYYHFSKVLNNKKISIEKINQIYEKINYLLMK